MASRVRRRSSRSFLRYAPNRLLTFASTVFSPRLEVTSTVSLTGYRRTFSCNRSDRTADYIPPGHTRVKEACFKFETAGARTPRGDSDQPGPFPNTFCGAGSLRDNPEPNRGSRQPSAVG